MKLADVAKTAKDWWWVVGLLVGAILFWGNLPTRVEKIEAGQVAQEGEIDDLKGWAKELQGYTRAQQEMNQQQQAPKPMRNLPLPVRGLREWDGEDCWTCALDDRQVCFDDAQWRRCK